MKRRDKEIRERERERDKKEREREREQWVKLRERKRERDEVIVREKDEMYKPYTSISHEKQIATNFVPSRLNIGCYQI